MVLKLDHVFLILFILIWLLILAVEARSWLQPVRKIFRLLRRMVSRS